MCASGPGWAEPYASVLPSIPGWFWPVDVYLFALIDELQCRAGVQGDLLEVGGYFGASAIALGFMCKAHESLVVNDLWEKRASGESNMREQDVYFSGAPRPGLTVDAFTANYSRFHSRRPDVRQGESHSELSRLRSKSFRFIHVDGSHEWDIVKGDSEQVVRLLAPGGVVAFDDVLGRGWPGVGAAVWPLVAEGELVPFATTWKLYATLGESDSVSPATVADAVEGSDSLAIVRRHRMFGTEVLEVDVAPVKTLPMIGHLRPYIPPALLESASRHSVGKRLRRILGWDLGRSYGEGGG